MEPIPSSEGETPPIRPRRSWRTVIVAVVAIGLVSALLGIGDVVRAHLQVPPVIKPYDPMPRW